MVLLHQAIVVAGLDANIPATTPGTTNINILTAIIVAGATKQGASNFFRMHFIYCHTCRVINPATLATPMGEMIMAFASEKEARHMLGMGFKLHSIISKEELDAVNQDALRRGLPILFFKDAETFEKLFNDPEGFNYAGCMASAPY